MIKTIWRSRAVRIVGAIAMLAALAPTVPGARAAGAPQDIGERVDLYGDPLPEGAIARLGTTRLRHPRQMTGLALSPDGALLATCGYNPEVRVWDVATGRLLRRLEGPAGQSGTVLFSADGSKLVVGGRSNQAGEPSVYIWDTATWDLEQTLIADRLAEGAPRGTAYEVAISPDGRLLATGGASTREKFRLWDLDTGVELLGRDWFAGSSTHSGSLAFSPDGRTLALGGKGDIRLWELGTREPAREIPAHPDRVSSLAYSPDGRTLFMAGSYAFNPREVSDFFSGARVTYSSSGVLRAWNIAAEEPELLWEIKPETRNVSSLAATPDGERLIGTYNGDLHMWSAATGEEIELPRAMTKGVIWQNKVSVSSDGRVLASGFSNSAAHLWDLNSLESIDPPGEGHEYSITALVYTSDGKTLVSGGLDDSIRFWDVATARQSRVIDLSNSDHDFSMMDLSADGRLVATGGEDATVRIWDARTGDGVTTYTAPARDPTAFRLSPDGGLLAVASYGESPDRSAADPPEDRVTIQIWDWDRDEVVSEFRQPYSEQPYTGLAFSPDGTKLFAAGRNIETARLWDVESGRLDFKFEIGRVVGSYTMIAVTQDFKKIATAAPHRAYPSTLGNRNLLYTGPSATIHLMDLATGEIEREISIHRDAVGALALTPDGRFLLSETWDEPWLTMYDLQAGRVAARFEHDPGLHVGGGGEYASLGPGPIAAAPDGRTAATAMDDGTILIWDLTRRN